MKKLLLLSLLVGSTSMLFAMNEPEKVKHFIAHKQEYIDRRMERGRNHAEAVREYRAELAALKKRYENRWEPNW